MAYNFEKALQSGLTPQDISNYLYSQGRGEEAENYFGQVNASNTDKLVGGIKGAGQRRLEGTKQAIEESKQGKITRPEVALRTVGEGAGFIGDILGEGLKAGFRALPDAIENPIREAGRDILDTSVGQAGLEALRSGMDKYEAWKAKNPRAAENLESVVNIASLIPIGRGAQVGGKAIGEGAILAREGAEAGLEAAGRAAKPALETAETIAEGAGRTIKRAVTRPIDAAGEALAKSSRLRTLPQAEAEAVRSGLDEAVVDFIQTSLPEDRKLYRQMLDIYETNKTTRRIAKQHKEIPGESILQRVTYISGQLEKEGKELGKVVDSMPDRIVNVQPELDEFVKILESRGVEVGINDAGENILINTGTAVTGDMPAYQLMYDLIKSGRVDSPKQLHGIRSRIFKEFDLAKSRQQPFSGDAENVAEVYRNILSKPLNTINPKYGEVSDKYRELIGPLQDFTKLIQYKGDIEKIGEKTLRTGEVARRVLGNASDRPTSVIQGLDEIAQKYGFTSDTSVMDQIRFADDLEKLFGTTQTTSLEGGVRAGVEQAAVDAAEGGIRGVALRAIKNVLGRTQKEQIEALRKLLSD